MNRPFRILCLASHVFCLAFAVCLWSCAPKNADEAPDPAMIAQGAKLAQQHCSGCHALPAPTDLDRTTWRRYILPRMGQLLGHYADAAQRDSLVALGRSLPQHGGQRLFPEQPLLPEADWQKIQTYYLAQAPDSLPSQQPAIREGLTQFRVKAPSFVLSPPSTTLARFAADGAIFIGDAHSKGFYHFGPDLQLRNMAQVREGAVSVADYPTELLITVMGSFAPTDQPDGFVMVLPKTAAKQPGILVDQLQRPVHTAIADLDQDGLEDLIISEFGKWTGGLAWWKNSGKGSFEKRWLRPTAGATKAYPIDLNRDSLPDVVALFGQGDEGIDAFYNEGNGQFRRENLLRFPPSHGSSFFELVDFNEDGHPDILYTAGDNADYTPIRKPYHGIYGYLNNGQNQFEPLFFYPLHGAYTAKATDFDSDGDLDIAAISFFPDYIEKTSRGFVYLENKGNYQFEASTFEAVDMGRWIVMDMADYDRDGDADLLLGSLAFDVPGNPALPAQWKADGVPFVVLENVGKSAR